MHKSDKSDNETNLIFVITSIFTHVYNRCHAKNYKI